MWERHLSTLVVKNVPQLTMYLFRNQLNLERIVNLSRLKSAVTICYYWSIQEPGTAEMNNVDTKRKTESDIKIFKDLISTVGSLRNPEDIGVEEIAMLLAWFFCQRTRHPNRSTGTCFLEICIQASIQYRYLSGVVQLSYYVFYVLSSVLWCLVRLLSQLFLWGIMSYLCPQAACVESQLCWLYT